MTTIVRVREDLQALRKESAEAARERAAQNSLEHGEIKDLLRTMNGTQRKHSVVIAELCKTTEHQGTELERGREERGTLFKIVRAIDKSRARQAGYMAGVIVVVVGALQYIVAPLVKHFLGG